NALKLNFGLICYLKKLLKESRMNHWGKLAFRWIYWNVLLKGIAIPFVSSNMSIAGKKIN
ncbi:MAG: hypothetical protein AAB212_03995, partial [Bacteroidota bacterium]